MIIYRCNLCRFEGQEDSNGPLVPLKWSLGKKLVVEGGSSHHLCIDCIIAVNLLAVTKFTARLPKE